MRLLAVLREKWVFRPLVLVLLLGLHLAAARLLGGLEAGAAAPREFTCSLPLPADVALKNDLPARPEVERIVLAGFFSDWAADDDRYRLDPAGPGRWSRRLALGPGDHQYKFVVYLKGRSAPVWTHDPRAEAQVADSYGGLNSVLHVPDYAAWRSLAAVLFLGLAALLVLYALLEPVLAWLLARRIGFRWKLVAALVLVAVPANLLFIAYQFHENRGLVREGLVDSLNLVHSALLGDGIDFRRLGEPAGRARLQASLTRLLWQAHSRVEKDKPSNLQVTLSDLAVLDAGFAPVAVTFRKDNASLMERRARVYGFSNAAAYLVEGVAGNLVAEARRDGPAASILLGSPDSRLLAHETVQTRRAAALLGANAFLLPIRDRGLVVGWYAGAFQPKMYGAELLRIAGFDLALLLVAVLFSFLLLRGIGGAVTARLSELAAWTERIIAGDFSEERRIATGDEIERLAANFDKMRLSLRESFARVEDRNRRLRIEAYLDALTCLPNRKRLLADLETQPCTALVLFDIDGFQEINDFFGGEFGDYILVEVANRLLERLDEGMRLYKIGGDEFVVMLTRAAAPGTTAAGPETGPAAAPAAPPEPMEASLLDTVAAAFCERVMEEPYRWRENEIYVSLTAGAAIQSPEDEPPQPAAGAARALDVDSFVLAPDSLPADPDRAAARRRRSPLARADMALKAARKLAARHLVYDESMELSREYEHNIQWTNKLKLAFKEDRVLPYFQPIVNNATGLVEKYECLVRLIERDGSVISPEEFLRVSKKSRYYRFITRTMLEKSFAAFRDVPWEFSLNISIEDILDRRTRDMLINRLAAEPPAARRLVFEIVESAEIENYDAVREFIAEAKALGARIAIDDFGTGYSNFEHLLRLNIDYIKIDASLVKHLDADTNAQAIVRTIARFARELGIRTIAEYVHSRAVHARTLEYGIDYSQGYYFGEPQPVLRG